MAARRLVDAAVAGGLIVILSPLMALIALLVRLSGRGPVLYRAERVGFNRQTLYLHKFRTMRHDMPGSRITGTTDPRVGRCGGFLRITKLDELPQLYDVLRGAMSFVGPRPEDPAIVQRCYSDIDLETLAVPPGLLSPGSLFAATHGDRYLTGNDPERAYCHSLLPLKLALDRVYLQNRTPWYDARLVLRAASIIIRRSLGLRDFPNPPELAEALKLLMIRP